MLVVWIKEAVNGTGDTVYLTEGTDTEKTNTDTKECEQLCKPFPFLSHSLLNVVEWSAETVSVLAYDTIFDSEQSL